MWLPFAGPKRRARSVKSGQVVLTTGQSATVAVGDTIVVRTDQSKNAQVLFFPTAIRWRAYVVKVSRLEVDKAGVRCFGRFYSNSSRCISDQLLLESSASVDSLQLQHTTVAVFGSAKVAMFSKQQIEQLVAGVSGRQG